MEEAQGGIGIAVAIKRNYFLLYHNEITSATQDTRRVYHYSSYVNRCALMKAGLF